MKTTTTAITPVSTVDLSNVAGGHHHHWGYGVSYGYAAAPAPVYAAAPAYAPAPVYAAPAYGPSVRVRLGYR
ncbi:MAG TPA: hypothetical protein VGM39_09325 [Kofleriaceae bacterium]|jgi:hypothetical protein